MGLDNPSNFKSSMPQFSANPKTSGGDQAFIQGPGYHDVQNAGIGQSLIALGSAIGHAGVQRNKEVQAELERKKEQQKRVELATLTATYETDTQKGYQEALSLPRDQQTVDGVSKYLTSRRESIAKTIDPKDPFYSDKMQHLDLLKANSGAKDYDYSVGLETSNVERSAAEQRQNLFNTTSLAVSDASIDPIPLVENYSNTVGSLADSITDPNKKLAFKQKIQDDISNMLLLNSQAVVWQVDSNGTPTSAGFSQIEARLQNPRYKELLGAEGVVKLKEAIYKQKEEASRALNSQFKEADKEVLAQATDQLQATGQLTPEMTSMLNSSGALIRLSPHERAKFDVAISMGPELAAKKKDFLAASPSQQARILAELSNSAKPADVANLKMLPPLKGVSDYSKVHHDGSKNKVDLPVPVGTEVQASYDGVVTDVGNKTLNGNYMTVTYKIDGHEYRATYLHLNGGPPLKAGEVVSSGQIIAHTGNTGKSTGPHLHLELYKDGQPQNVQEFMTGNHTGVDSLGGAKYEYMQQLSSK